MNKNYLMPPAICPICGGPTSVHEEESGVKTLWCDNPNCEGKLVNRIVHYCDMKKGMAIKGLSKATIEKLIDWGWLNTIKDLYELSSHRSEWNMRPGFGPKSVDNLLAAIENSKKCELWQFISALGIPLIGVNASKQLAAEFGTWANFFNSNQENFIYSMLPNFGEEMESSLLGFDLTLANEIATTYLSFADPQKKVDSNGLIFCVTGKLNRYKNRTELQKYIESIGGKVTGSVSKNTSYLINNDLESTSIKNMAAQKLSIPIISEETFIELFGLQN